MRSTINTIGAMIDNGYKLYVYCASENCHEGRQVDLEALADRFDRDHGAMHWDLVKMPWRCVTCEGRKVSFRIEPAGNEYDHHREPRGHRPDGIDEDVPF